MNNSPSSLKPFFANPARIIVRCVAAPLFGAAALLSTHAIAQTNQYQQGNRVATSAAYNPQIIDPGIANAWGIAIRPAGLGGHFWVTANGNGSSNQFVGDVGGRPLSSDALAYVQVAGPGNQPGAGTPTGVVFNSSGQFKVTQTPTSGANLNSITAPAKFLFATDNGVISGWTERTNAASPSGFDWPLVSTAVIDRSAQGSQFFGIGLSRTGRLYAADFGVDPALRVYDGDYNEVGSFRYPVQNGTGTTPGYWVPFNVQVLENEGRESVWVTYAKSKPDETDRTRIYAGEEDAGTGNGLLAELSLHGQLIRSCDGAGLLNAPWGLAVAPSNFGAASNQLLVSNFGDGTIVGFNLNNCNAGDYLRDNKNEAVAIEGIWGLQFGNGASLGEANRLYFAAGPEDETAGLFGYLSASDNAAAVPLPSTAALLLPAIALFLKRKAKRVEAV